MKVTKVMWPLFWCLKPEDQAKLMQWQWDNYGFRLEIPPLLGGFRIDTALESPEEIDRLMRQPPKHQKRVA